MNARRESAVLGIKTQHKATKGKSKVAVLQEKLKTLEAEYVLADKTHKAAQSAALKSYGRLRDAEAKLALHRVKLAAAGG